MWSDFKEIIPSFWFYFNEKKKDWKISWETTKVNWKHIWEIIKITIKQLNIIYHKSIIYFQIYIENIYEKWISFKYTLKYLLKNKKIQNFFDALPEKSIYEFKYTTMFLGNACFLISVIFVILITLLWVQILPYWFYILSVIITLLIYEMLQHGISFIVYMFRVNFFYFFLKKILLVFFIYYLPDVNIYFYHIWEAEAKYQQIMLNLWQNELKPLTQFCWHIWNSCIYLSWRDSIELTFDNLLTFFVLLNL